MLRRINGNNITPERQRGKVSLFLFLFGAGDEQKAGSNQESKNCSHRYCPPDMDIDMGTSQDKKKGKHVKLSGNPRSARLLAFPSLLTYFYLSETTFNVVSKPLFTIHC
jgi:hypothetical protein